MRRAGSPPRRRHVGHLTRGYSARRGARNSRREDHDQTTHLRGEPGDCHERTADACERARVVSVGLERPRVAARGNRRRICLERLPGGDGRSGRPPPRRQWRDVACPHLGGAARPRRHAPGRRRVGRAPAGGTGGARSRNRLTVCGGRGAGRTCPTRALLPRPWLSRRARQSGEPRGGGGETCRM